MLSLSVCFDCLVIGTWSLNIALKFKSSWEDVSDQIIIKSEEH